MDDVFEERQEGSGELGEVYTPCVPEEYTPHLGMEFESEVIAYDFYNNYGRYGGFSIRKNYFVKNRTDGSLISGKLVCSKEGEREGKKQEVKEHRRETRTKCGAFMCIKLNPGVGRWAVTKFEKQHNHPLHVREVSHMLPSQRKLSHAQGLNAVLAMDNGITLKASHDLMSAQVGGREHLGFMREDLKGYLRARREREMEYGEAGSVLRYLQNQAKKNPGYYHAYQLDAAELITNIFWADHQMILDYGHFGDVVTFDTTFRTNKEYRPLACFVGFNNYRETVVFGTALLYDETAQSFEWLFKTFLHAMSGKKPVTIFTDQDQAMAKAIQKVMPDVCHGLCTWHLIQNAVKHLGYLFGHHSNFRGGLNACFYKYEDEDELIESWEKLVSDYDLRENSWMNQTWAVRHKWAHVYMKWTFTAGIRSTQLSESMNARLRNYLRADHSITEFFTHFERVTTDIRYNEWKSLFKSREQLPKLKMKKCLMLLQAARSYTHTIFELFQEEFDTSLSCQVNECNQMEGQVIYVVREYGKERTYTVKDNAVEQIVCCSCRKFEHFEILCSHAIKILDRMNVIELPSKYILGRWRRDAKDSSSHESIVSVNEDDPKLVASTRYRTLCLKVVYLVAHASRHKDAYERVWKTIDELYKEVNLIIVSEESVSGGNVDNIEGEIIGEDVADPNLAQVKGLKKKNGVRKGGKRLKPWHEKIGRKKKRVSKPSMTSQSNIPDTTSIHHSCPQEPQVRFYVPHLPQAMNYSPNLFIHGNNYPHIPHFQASTSSSSQSSNCPQFTQDMALNIARTGGTGTESSHNETFFDFFGTDRTLPPN